MVERELLDLEIWLLEFEFVLDYRFPSLFVASARALSGPPMW